MRKSKEEIIKELEDRKNWYLAAAKAWDAVTIEKTKSGKEFSQLARALKNAKVSDFYEKATHPKINVYFKTGSKYNSDDLQAYHYMDELPKTDPRREEKTTINCLRRTVKKTPDELREDIKKKIENYKALAEKEQKQIDKAADIIDTFEKAFKDFKLNLEKESGKNSSLYHAIMENVRSAW